MSFNDNNSRETVVFVSNLAFSVNEGTLMRLLTEKFNMKYGKINLPKDKFTDQSRGFAFIDLLDNATANKAVLLLNGHELNGRLLSCTLRKPDKTKTQFSQSSGPIRESIESTEKTIYISNLEFSITKQNIEEMCEDLLHEEHPVQGIKFPIDRDNGNCRGFCYVTFQKPESVLAAIEAFDGLPVLGRELKVSRYQSKDDRTF
eukprot:gene17832-23444_t